MPQDDISLQTKLG